MSPLLDDTHFSRTPEFRITYARRGAKKKKGQVRARSNDGIVAVQALHFNSRVWYAAPYMELDIMGWEI